MRKFIYVGVAVLLCVSAAHAQIYLGGALSAGTTTGDPVGAAADLTTTFVSSAHAALAARSDPACVETKVVGGVTTTINHFTPDGLDCAGYRATIATTGSVSTLLHITTGVHYINQQILVPKFASSKMTIWCDPGASVVANADMGPMVYAAPGSQQVGSFTVIGECNWNLNNHATGAIDVENMGAIHIYEQQSAEYIKQGDTRYSYYTFGAPTAGVGDVRIYHAGSGAGGGAKSGTFTDIRATLSGGHTGYITGGVVGMQASGCAVTNPGTAPNATITTGTFQATVTGGGFTDEPTIYYTVGSNGLVSSCAVDKYAYGFMGSSAPTATVLASGPTGAVLTVSVNTGGYKYLQNLDGLGRNNGMIAFLLGHGHGKDPCLTMPPTYDNTSPNYGKMVNPPTFTFSGDGLNYITAMNMPAGVDPTAWTANCSDQYTTPDGVVHDVPILFHIYTGEGIANNIVTRLADSDASNFDGVSAFQCGVQALNGGNKFSTNHFYGEVRYGFCDSGGNHWEAMEHDSQWDALGLVTNANSTVTHTRMGYDQGGTHAGAAIMVWAQGSGSGQTFKDSIQQASTVYPNHFTKYICPAGPCEAAGVGYSSAYRIDDGNGVTEPAHEFQPLGMKAFVFNHATASVAAQTIHNITGSIQLSLELSSEMSCDAVATGTATLNVTYQTTANFAKTVSYPLDCSVAGADTQQARPIRVYPNSSITAYLTNTSGVSVSGSVSLDQKTPN